MLNFTGCEKIIGADAIRFMTIDELAEVAARFWPKTEEGPDGCLLWTGAESVNGYGGFRVADTVAQAHRVAYELSQGPIPAGFIVRQKCHNRLCMRHLELGTHADNSRDMIEAGRGASGMAPEDGHSIRGHQLLGLSRKQTVEDFGVTMRQVDRVRAGTHHVTAMDVHLDAVLAAEASQPAAALDPDAP